MKWGRPRPTFPSRFLYEMTGQADNPNRQLAIAGARKELGVGRAPGAKGPTKFNDKRVPGKAAAGKPPAQAAAKQSRSGRR
jgi:hypothetical protein